MGGTTFAVIKGTPPPIAGIHNINLFFRDMIGSAFGKIVSMSFFGTFLNVFNKMDDGSKDNLEVSMFFSLK
jgi:hypothetical protein